jgi:hypothetical protein
MSEPKKAIEIPYYTGWTWVLFSLSFILFVLSICIASVSKKETKAELLISYIILFSCMFIGTIPFIIKTVMSGISNNVRLFILYIFILICSVVNFTGSGILLNKLEKEEEEEDIKYYSRALIVLSSVFSIFYLGAGIIESGLNYLGQKFADSLVPDKF